MKKKNQLWFLVLKKFSLKIDKEAGLFKRNWREKDQKIQNWRRNIKGFKKEVSSLLDQKKELKLKIQGYIKNQIEQVKEKFSINISELKEKVKEDLTEQWMSQIKKQIEREEKYNRESLQKDSFFQLNKVLNRLDRLYCPERGIKPVSFKNNKELLESLAEENNSCLNEIEKRVWS